MATVPTAAPIPAPTKQGPICGDAGVAARADCGLHGAAQCGGPSGPPFRRDVSGGVRASSVAAGGTFLDLDASGNLVPVPVHHRLFAARRSRPLSSVRLRIGEACKYLILYKS